METATKSCREPIENRLARLAERVRSLRGWRHAGLALGAGAVSVLAMPPFFMWPVLLVTLPVLVWLIDASDPETAGGKPSLDRARLLRAGVAGFLFAYGFHVAGLYWLREAFLVTGGSLAMLWPLGVLGLPAILAIYHGLAAAFSAAAAPRGPWRVVALAVGLGISEWLRGNLLTGFPWNVLGIALTSPDTLMQSAGLLGIYGLTTLAVLMLALPAVILAETTIPGHHWKTRWAAVTALALPLAAMIAYGTVRLSEPSPGWVDGVRIRLVQPSIPQREKWMADKQPEFVEKQLSLSLRDPDGKYDGLADVTHVIWPEAAMPFLPLQRPEVLARIGQTLPDGVHLVAGVLRLERQPVPAGAGDDENARTDVYNSMAVLDPDGRPIHIYDKTHLVPFGEYLPFQSFLERLGLSALTRQRGGFSVGPEPRPLLTVPGMPGAAPLICYEAVFPGTSAKSRECPHVLVNVTNDGWFGNSSGPRQHLHQARLRAVEDGVPLLRVANNGITAAFDAHGRELARLDMDVAGVIDTRLPARIAPPPYARFGDLIFFLICVKLLTLLYRFRITIKP